MNGDKVYSELLMLLFVVCVAVAAVGVAAWMSRTTLDLIDDCVAFDCMPESAYQCATMMDGSPVWCCEVIVGEELSRILSREVWQGGNGCDVLWK